ncbi:c-type cytochrome biogenesis protein CcsB [Nocardia zapadnayensis]|nr:c-type cytochrome biogenesis protein CcsB [Nocardia zapadnayensis]MCX0277201.1 c-type cytochrome biogenesis protein CcsB [Nocardia zapadnayensis]
MDVDYELASWSNLLTYSAMAVYAIAFIVYAFDLFGGQRLRSTEAASGDRKATAGARGAGSADRSGARADTRTSARSGVRRTSRGASVAILDEADTTTAEAPASGGPADGAGAGSGGRGGVKGRASGGDAAEELDLGPRSRKLARIATSLTVLALVLHMGAVLTRALSVMRVPWGNMMEYAMTAAAIAGIVYLVALRFRDMRYLGTFVTGAILVTLGLCITVFYTPAAQLVPALQNYWIYIHVPIAILSTALLSVSAAMALFQICKAWSESRGSSRRLAFMDRVPSSGDIEQVSYRIAAVGFITWTFTLIAGAIWAELAWGRPWGWDSKEIWTFVVWVIYAAYLHARATRGWGPTKVAVLNLIGMASLVFNFAIVNVYFDGLHSYSGI